MNKYLHQAIYGKTINEWTEKIPVISSIVKKEETIWLNDKKESFARCKMKLQ